MKRLAMIAFAALACAPAALAGPGINPMNEDGGGGHYDATWIERSVTWDANGNPYYLNCRWFSLFGQAWQDHCW